MAVYKDEFRFKLSKPIKYQAKVGQGYGFVETTELILRAPSLRNHYRTGNILQALFTPAMLKAQKAMLEIADSIKDIERPKKKEIPKDKIKEAEKEVEEDEGKKVIANFGILSLGKDINEFYDIFENLLTSDKICFLDDKETQISVSELRNEKDGLLYDDFKQLTAEYIANFFIASWMRDLGGN